MLIIIPYSVLCSGNWGKPERAPHSALYVHVCVCVCNICTYTYMGGCLFTQSHVDHVTAVRFFVRFFFLWYITFMYEVSTGYEYRLLDTVSSA